MATLKKDIIIFSNGKQINVPNSILSITRKLELTDYYSRSVFFCDSQPTGERKTDKVVNIYNLSRDEIIEIADAMIRLWIDLKDNVRALGIEDPEIFNIRKSDK